MSDSTVKLGETPKGDSGHRDAIHVAVFSAKVEGRLSPGQHVGIVADGVVGFCNEPIGIIDPFLKGAVFKGEAVWVLLYPGTITGLRHVWEHPKFSVATNDKVKAEEWIRTFAASIEKTYAALMDAAREHLSGGGYVLDNSEDYKNAGPSEWETFWKNFCIVTGEEVPAGLYAPYTCSC